MSPSWVAVKGLGSGALVYSSENLELEGNYRVKVPLAS